MSVKEKLQDILGIKILDQDNLENDDYSEEKPADYYEEDTYGTAAEEEYEEERSRSGGLFNFGTSRRERRAEREARLNDLDQEETGYQRETSRSRFGRSYSYEESLEEKRQSPVQMVLVKAKRFSEVERIAENLRQQRSVIINFDEMDKNDAQRTIDFLSGVAFAMKGTVQKVSKCTIVFAVGRIDLVGRIEEMSSREGVFSML